MAEFKQNVGFFEVFSVSGQVDQYVNVHVTCGEHCDITLYLNSEVARALADILKEAADVADK